MERMIKSWICMNASRFSMCMRRVCAKMHALSVGIRSGVFYGAEDEKGCVFLFLIFPSTDLSSSLLHDTTQNTQFYDSTTTSDSP
jgi:hypothetical protein